MSVTRKELKKSKSLRK